MDQLNVSGEEVQRTDRRRTIRRRRWIAGVLAVLLALTVRFAMPETLERFREQAEAVLCGNVDFPAAAQAIGRGISGEVPLREAAREACTYAFAPTAPAETDARA